MFLAFVELALILEEWIGVGVAAVTLSKFVDGVNVPHIPILRLLILNLVHLIILLTILLLVLVLVLYVGIYLLLVEL